MLHIHIEIERPVAFALSVVAIVGLAVLASGGEKRVEAIEPAGGEGAQMLIDALGDEEKLKRLKVEQFLLERREEIVRASLRNLEAERLSGAPFSEADAVSWAESQRELLGLLRDRVRGEAEIRATLEQIWEARGISRAASLGSPGLISLSWPVEPLEGLSAVFLDSSYEERFGIPHEAIDIPVLQGTPVAAAADGIVEEVADNGMGYSFAVIRHAGYSTLYGHLSAFAVTEGESVRAGDIIGSSGGRPGSAGAGALTTGPHLHFELLIDGENVDPEEYLPKR